MLVSSLSGCAITASRPSDGDFLGGLFRQEPISLAVAKRMICPKNQVYSDGFQDRAADEIRRLLQQGDLEEGDPILTMLQDYSALRAGVAACGAE